MLQLVKTDRPLDRLSVAAAHIEAAIAHINNEAQARIPWSHGGDHANVEILRLLVRALGDIRDELKGSGRQCSSVPATTSAADAATH